MNKCTIDRWFGGKHDWSNWEEIDRAEMINTLFTDPWDHRASGISIVQERYCKGCGFKQINTKYNPYGKR